MSVEAETVVWPMLDRLSGSDKITGRGNVNSRIPKLEQPEGRSPMSVASVPAAQPEVKIPNGNPGVTYREAAGFPSYAIGDDGSVWSRCKYSRSPSGDWRRLRPYRISAKEPHFAVRLYRNGERHNVLLHRAVLATFVGPCPEGMEGCHDPDSDPANNHLKNLRWATREDNQRDSIRHGTFACGERSPKSRLTAENVIEIRRLLSLGWTMQRIADLFGVYSSSISNVKHRKSWAHIA